FEGLLVSSATTEYSACAWVRRHGLYNLAHDLLDKDWQWDSNQRRQLYNRKRKLTSPVLLHAFDSNRMRTSFDPILKQTNTWLIYRQLARIGNNWRSTTTYNRYEQQTIDRLPVWRQDWCSRSSHLDGWYHPLVEMAKTMEKEKTETNQI
ncbi:MAG: hypothetical protein Q9182_007097, partial [Xanthomendoza sp. 2 TL-2023]